MGDTTTNYGFFLPDEEDSMADVETNITNNFQTIEPVGDPTVIAAGADLPQEGDYNLFDRVFRNDPTGSTTWPSVYLLVCKDANWGWHWRPIQQITSPWVTITNDAISDVNFEIHPTNPLRIALDSRGWCHWRGCIRSKVPGISAATSFNALKTIPLGLRPCFSFMHTIALSPVLSGAGKAGNVGGRLFMREDGANSVRVFNSNNGISQNIWFDGLHYNTAYHWYYNA